MLERFPGCARHFAAGAAPAAAMMHATGCTPTAATAAAPASSASFQRLHLLRRDQGLRLLARLLLDLLNLGALLLHAERAIGADRLFLRACAFYDLPALLHDRL